MKDCNVCFRSYGRHGSSINTVKIYCKSIFQNGDHKPEVLSFLHITLTAFASRRPSRRVWWSWHYSWHSTAPTRARTPTPTRTSSPTSSRGSSRECRRVVQLAIGITSGNRVPDVSARIVGVVEFQLDGMNSTRPLSTDNLKAEHVPRTSAGWR